MAINSERATQSIRFAILGCMFPGIRRGRDSRLYLMISNGKDASFIKPTRDMKTLEYCSNLKSACSSIGAKVDLMDYAMGNESEAEAVARVYESMSNKYMETENFEEWIAFVKTVKEVTRELPSIGIDSEIANALQLVDKDIDRIVEARKRKDADFEPIEWGQE